MNLMLLNIFLVKFFFVIVKFFIWNFEEFGGLSDNFSNFLTFEINFRTFINKIHLNMLLLSVS